MKRKISLVFLICGITLLDHPTRAMEEDKTQFSLIHVKHGFLEPYEQKDQDYVDKLSRVLEEGEKESKCHENRKAVDIYLEALSDGSPLFESLLIAYRLAEIVNTPEWKNYVGAGKFEFAKRKIESAFYSLLADEKNLDPRKDEALFYLYFTCKRLSQEIVHPKVNFEKILPLEERIDHAINEGRMAQKGQKVGSPPYLLRMIASHSHQNELWICPHKLYQLPSTLIHKLIKLAAEGNDPEAQFNLGLNYLNINDEGSYIHWMTQAAELNFVPAQHDLGYYYWHDAKSPDLDKAIYWLTRAAELEDAEAQVALGMIFEDIDIKKAISWYTKAAMQRNPDAEHQLGAIYERDNKMPKLVAINFYTRADEDGALEAAGELDRLLQAEMSIEGAEKEQERLRLNKEEGRARILQNLFNVKASL